MVSAIEKRLVPSLLPMPPDIEALRVYLVVPEIAFLLDDSSYLNRLMIPLGNRILSLKPEAEKVLGKWNQRCPYILLINCL